MPLRVLHVTPYSDAAWAYGGIPRVVGALTRGLADRGNHVTVCTTDAHDQNTRLPGNRRGRWQPWSAGLQHNGVHVRVFPNLSNACAYRLQAFAPIGLIRYLRENVRGFDVAHLHGRHHLLGSLASRYLFEAGVPYVLAPNGTGPVHERRATLKRSFDAIFEATLFRHASRVLAVSEAERQQLSGMDVDRALVRVVPNPLCLDEFRTPVVPGRARALWRVGSAPVVLFLGKITPRKNVDTLVRAFGRLKDSDVTLVIAGNDMGGGQHAKRIARDLGLLPRVLFAGLLRGQERLNALADADVVVYPSENEVFGLVPFESILCGTPVVVAGDSGCGEWIRYTGGGRVVDVNEVQELSDAIADVLGDQTSWRRAALMAADVVRATFGEGRVSAQIESIYEGILRQRSAVTPS